MRAMIKKIKYIAILSILIISNICSQDWQSNIVYFGDDDKLVYERDSLGNAIPDFSYVGYKNRNDTIPFIPVVKTISPIEGDNTSHINNTLFEIALNNPIHSRPP